MLRANDLLAGLVADLAPPELRTYDLDSHSADLPNMVFVPVLASAEHRFGLRTSLGTAIYGGRPPDSAVAVAAHGADGRRGVRRLPGELHLAHPGDHRAASGRAATVST